MLAIQILKVYKEKVENRFDSDIEKENYEINGFKNTRLGTKKERIIKYKVEEAIISNESVILTSASDG